MLNNNNIKIALLEISPQNKAILEFYFERAGNKLYKVVDEDKADAFIIDYDQPSAKEHVERIHANCKAPIVLMSIREQDIPSSIWVAKPVTADALSKAAASINEMLAENEQAENSVVENEVVESEVVESEVVINESVESVENEITENEQVENEDDVLEVLSEMHIENDESTLDETINETIEEFSSLGDTSSLTSTEDIDELEETAIKDFSEISVENSIENSVGDSLESSIEKAEIQESNAITAGLTLAAASALVVTTAEFDVEETEVENQADENSFSDFTETLTEDLNDDINIENDVEDEIDSLLDSLTLDGVEEDSIEVILDTSNEDEEISLDNLLSDIELETDASSVDQNQDTFDLLKTVDNELEGNFDLQKSIDDKFKEEKLKDNNENEVELLTEDNSLENDLEEDTEKEKSEAVVETEKNVVNENFTLHDDQEPSTETVFADTLEINYADIKPDQTDKLSEDSEPLTNQAVEDLMLDLENSSVDQESDTSVTHEDNLDNDFLNFDFDALETTDEGSDTALGTDDELELVLDEDAVDDVDAENSIDSEPDDDLDNLISEVSDNTIDAKINNNQNVNVNEDNLDNSDLQSLLNEVREEADKNSNNSDSSAFEADLNESAHEHTKAERRWMQLCGNLQTIQGQKEVAKISFDQDKFLLSVVLEQIKLSKNKEHLLRLKYKDLIIVFDCDRDKIYCNLALTNDEYSSLCFNEIDFKKLKIHDLDYSEERLYRSKIEKNPNRAHTIESFIWTTSLLTSRGRLPKNTHVTKTVGIKTWPNLTRLELIPHAMNMAAVFAKHPGNLIEISDWLQIPQRYVFAFYNAALSLEMIDFDCKKVKKSRFSFGKKGADKNSEERGFFGRLLKRLKS